MEELSSNKDSVSRGMPSVHEILTFEMGGRLFGIWPSDLLEIVEEKEYIPIPNSSDFLNGIINSHGRIVTVVDLNKLVGTLHFEWGEGRRVAILNDEDFTIGLLVPSEIRIDFYTGEIKELGVCKETDFFKGIKLVFNGREREINILNTKCVYEYLKDYFKKRSIRSM